MKRCTRSRPAPRRRSEAARDRRTLAVALIVLMSGAFHAGCAMYAELDAPAYSKQWESFAAQAAEPTRKRMPSPGITAATEEQWESAYRAVPKAKQAVEQARQAVTSGRTREEAVNALEALEEAEMHARTAGDAAAGAWLRAKIEELRVAVEDKLLQIARIEPAFDVRKLSEVRVAVVKIGEGVETVREGEMEAWKNFIAGAGFGRGAVFIQAPLAGAEGSLAAIRTAAARLRADAVLAYTTFTAPTTSPFGESVAVLSFAKCMLLDTRTEYLYLNAEGEDHEKRLGVPGFLCVKCLEEECMAGAIEGLRREVVHELQRIREEEGGG